MKRALVIFSFLIGCIQAHAYCVSLTINHAKVPNTDQTNFRLLVHGTYWWMADAAHGGLAVNSNSGHDIRFYSNSGCTTGLDFQRVYWINTTGDSSWLVRTPTASHTSDTTIYIGIGVATNTTDISTKWMGSYGVVGYYPGADSATLDTTDSGSANLTLACGASTTVTSASSPIGGGFFFPTGSTDNQTCGWTPTVTGDTLGAHGYPVHSQQGHVRIWYKNTSNTQAGDDVTPGAYGKANSTGQRGFESEYRTCQVTGMGEQPFGSPGPGITTVNSSAACGSSTTPLFTADLNWHVLDFDQPFDGATYSQAAVYIDGTKINPALYFAATGSTVIDTSDTPVSFPGDLRSEIRIGRMAAHGVGWFTGYATGFEVTSTSWSDDLVTARYNNENSPSTFYTLGAIPGRAYGVTMKGATFK